MEFLEFPLAYHITFGTYGTRLHGDPRGTVSRGQNKFGEPIIGRDDDWRQVELSLLGFAPVYLTVAQRLHAESVIPAICQRGGWEYRIAAAQPDHAHALLSTARDGKAVRKWLKRWLGEELSSRWPLAIGQTWWAEGGSVKWVWTESYLEDVYEYIKSQRTTPEDPPRG